MLKAASSRGLAGCVAMRKKGRDNIWEDSNSLFFAGRFSPRTTPNWKPLSPCLFKQWKCMPKKSAFAISWTLMNERSQIERHQVNPFFLLRPRSNLSSQEMHFKIFLFILVLKHKVFFARILKSFQSRAWTKQYFSTGTHSPWESCVTLERRISSEYKSNLTNTLWSLSFQTNVNSRNRYTSSLRAAFPKFRLGVCKDFYFTRTAAKSVSWFSRPLHEVQTTIIWTSLENKQNSRCDHSLPKFTNTLKCLLSYSLAK